jgi:hypothetical protein
MPGYTSDLYNYIVGLDPTFKNDVSLEQFKSKMSDTGYSKNMYDWVGQNDKTFHSDVSFDAFREKLGYKKKGPTVLPSVQKPAPISSGTQPKVTQKPSATSVSQKNKQVEVFTNFPTKEDNEYRIVNNNWQRKEPGKEWSTVRDSNAIIGLNKQYKKNIVPNEGFEGISSKLIDNSEETVVPYLQKNYGNLGFKFEETGAGDRVRVVTEDGKNSEIFTLDNWTDEGDSTEAVRLKAWLKENTNTIQRERYSKIDSEISSIKNAKPKEKADLTKDAFANMSAGIPDDLSLDIKSQLKLKEKEKEAMQYNKSRMNALMDDISKAKKTEGKVDDAEARARVAAIYGNKDEIAKQNRYINNSLNDIARVSTATNQRSKEYDQDVVKWQADLEQNNGVETPELAERKKALEGRAEMLNKEVSDLDQNLKLSKVYQSQLDDIAGEYMLFKESKGSTGGAMVNNFVKGATNILRFAGLERSSQEELIKAIGSDYTTKEYATSKDRSDIEKVLFSLSNSIGAAVGGGGVAAPVSFFAQSYYDVKDEMDDNPDFNSVPELEKTLVAGTIGVAVGFLEKFGLDRLMSKTPIGKNIVNRILLRSVKDLPKKATAEMLEESINSNMKRLLAKGALNVAGGMIVEGSTEFAQELAEGGVKELYNAMKGKEMFQSPESLLAQSFEAAYLGAMGGAVMQAPVQAANVIATGLSNKNKLLTEVLEKSVTDSELRSMMTSKIKTQILNGEITKEEGQKQLDAVNEAAVTFDKLPDNITEEARSKSFDLLIEKSKIEKEIAGKDENLVSAQKARIASINNELKTISENATKESNVEEVTAEGGGLQREGAQEGQPQVGEGEGPVGETTQQGTDLGNRPVEGRGIQEEGVTRDVINRPSTLSEFGGNTFETPLQGDTYVEGQQVVFEDRATGRIYELGNIDEVMDSSIPGLQAQEETISITPEGKVSIEGNNWNIQSELPTQGIEYNPAGEVTRVSLKDDAGNTQMFEGQQAVDIAYQIELQKIQSPEQQQFINDLLEQDEEFQTATESIKPRQIEAVVQEEAVTDTVQAEPTVAEEVTTEEAVTPEVQAEVESLGNLLEGTDQQIDEQVGGLRVSKSNNKVAQSIANAAKAIAKILPSVKFVVHDTDASYRKATNEEGRSQSSSGEYNNKTKTIHINASKANNRTAAHEVFHAILLNKIGSDIELQRLTKAMIDSVLKSLPKTKGSEEVVAYLEKFASQYDDKTIFNEEKLAELFGILADNYAKLPNQTQNIIQRFIDRVRKILGLKPMTDKEVIDFMNTISQKVARGQEITQKDISKISTDNTISKVNKRFQADFSDAVSKLTFVFDKNGSQFKKLEDDGYITRDKSLSDFNGKYIFLHQPDAAFSGMIFKDGEVLVEGKGGVFYPIKFHEDGYFWASTDRTAKKMAEDLNKVMEQNGGTIYMALTSAPSDKLMSSTTMANAILDFFSSKALDKNFKVTPTQLKSALRKAANDVKTINNKKVGLDLKLPANATIEEMQSAIRTALGSENSSFADRKNFAVELTKLMASEINKNDIAVNQFGKLFSEGIQNKYFKGITKTGKLKISAANMTQALSEMFTEPMLKEGIDREKGGQVYAILELNGPVKPEPSTKHESYPMAIESANKNNKVTLHLLNDRQNWSDTFEDFETGDIVSKERQLKIFPTSGVSVQGLKVNTSKVAPRKQLTAPNGKPSNLNEQQWNQVRTPEFKKWFGDWENDPQNASKVVDENGEPLVVYHGTRKSFDEFSFDVKPSNFRESTLYGFWFTSNKKNSELYGGNIMEVFLNSKNPIDINYKDTNTFRNIVVPIDKPRAMSVEDFNRVGGNIKFSELNKGIQLRLNEDKSIDGIIHRNIKDILLSDNFQVFNPIQIKSATENEGTFSTIDASIRKQKADTISGMVFTARQNGFSDAAISQYLLGKGYTQEQIDGALSAKAGTKNIDDIFEASEQEIRDKVKRKSIREFFRALTRTTLNRQVDIKRALAGLKNKQAQKALSRLITKAGASGLASIRFKIAAKDIYGKLKEADIKILDRIIYARRIISINENRAMKGLEPYRGMSGYSEVNAQQDLNDIKNEIGEEKFNDLNERAGKYFDVFKKNLKKLKDSGRISKEVYNDLNEIEYSPIATIKYIISDNIDVTDMDREASRLGISKEDIKKLTDRNENGIITDSRYLLAMNISSVESRAFENAMLNEVVKALDEATTEQQVALSEYIVFDNPIIGSFKDGRPKRKYDDQAVPNGFKKVYYFENGIEKYIIVREDMARQLLDVKNSKVQAAIENTAKTVPVVGTALKTITLTPARLLRFFATGGNPLFILGNVAVDWVNAVFNTDVYSNLKAYGMVQAGLGFAKNFIKKAVTSDTFNKTYNEFAEHGGLMDFLSNESMRSLNELKPGHKIFSPLHKAVEMYGTVMSFLGETSEVAMRLAVYEKMKSNLMSEFKKENGVDPNAQQMDDIMWEAAREARELIDFNQGGSWAKEADVVMPYLNAALQGFRKPLEYAKKNPVGFASSYIQLAGMGASIAAMSLAAAMNAMPDDDDDEEKKKKIRKALDSISDHEKASYHIIFTGKVDKNGELEYIRIKKLPVASVATTLAEQMMYKYLVDYKFDEATFNQTIEKSLPFSISELESKNPVVSGYLTYKYNEDTFTGEKVFRGPKDKVILETAEGVNDPKIEAFYKSVAPVFGLSPARSKAFVEKIITNQSTNPTINIFYAAANGIFGKDTQFGTEFSTAMEKMKEAAGKKLIRYTNENVLKYKKEDELEKEKVYITTEKYLKDSKIKADIKSRYNEGKTMTVGELIKIVKENYEPIDQERYFNKYYTYTQTMNTNPALLDLLYEDDPNIQALMINDMYGPNLDKEEMNELGEVMNKSRMKVSDKTWYIYQNKYKNRK